MPGGLDEISRAIGQQEANIANLNVTFTDHCRDDDRRHEENIGEMRKLNDAMRELKTALVPMAASVAFMRPIVDSYQESKWKTAGAVSLAFTIMGAFGWLVTVAVSKLVEWGLSHIK